MLKKKLFVTFLAAMAMGIVLLQVANYVSSNFLKKEIGESQFLKTEESIELILDTRLKWPIKFAIKSVDAKAVGTFSKYGDRGRDFDWSKLAAEEIGLDDSLSESLEEIEFFDSDGNGILKSNKKGVFSLEDSIKKNGIRVFSAFDELMKGKNNEIFIEDLSIDSSLQLSILRKVFGEDSDKVLGVYHIRWNLDEFVRKIVETKTNDVFVSELSVMGLSKTFELNKDLASLDVFQFQKEAFSNQHFLKVSLKFESSFFRASTFWVDFFVYLVTTGLLALVIFVTYKKMDKSFSPISKLASFDPFDKNFRKDLFAINIEHEEVEQLTANFSRLSKEALEIADRLKIVERMRVELKESILEGFLFLNADREIIDSNAVARDFLGLNKDEALARPFLEQNGVKFDAVGEMEKGQDLFDLILEGSSFNQIQAKVKNELHSDAIFAKFSLWPCRDEDQNVTGVFVLFNDYTAEKVAIDKAQNSHRMASIGEMVGGITKELSEPLTAVLESSDRMKLLGEAGFVHGQGFSDDIEAIIKHSKKIEKVVDGLSSLTKYESNEPMRTALISSIVEDTLAFCRTRFATQNVQLKTNIKNREAKISCRSVQISQVILNLLNNAFEVVKNQIEGWIEVSVEVIEDRVEIRIIDSGLSRLTSKKGLQLVKSEDDLLLRGNRTNLGINVSAKIIEDHKGSLSIDSSGPNTCLLVTLPVVGRVQKTTIKVGKSA